MSITDPTEESVVRDAEAPVSGSSAAVREPGARQVRALRAVILLGGKVRQTPLTSGIARSVLDLPLTSEHTLLDAWLTEAVRIADFTGQEKLSVRVVVDRGAIVPAIHHDHDPRVEVEFERDPGEYRGTAGVLKDVTADYGPDEWVLMASAAQLQIEPLGSLLADLQAAPGDVVLVSHADGTPSSTMLVRVGCLAGVAEVGYVDMKEQALPDIRREHLVTVVERPRATAVPVRTVSDYVDAVRAHHHLASGRPPFDDPYVERWEAEFAVVEDGAQVAPEATLVDSVVLAGGVVEDRAVVVRSVVGPGGVVRRRTRLIGDVIGAGGGAR